MSICSKNVAVRDKGNYRYTVARLSYVAFLILCRSLTFVLTGLISLQQNFLISFVSYFQNNAILWLFLISFLYLLNLNIR